MAWRPDIRTCPLPVPPVEEDSGALQCSKCREVLYDASSVTEAESRSLASLGRCGRWLLDRSGRVILTAAALAASGPSAAGPPTKRPVLDVRVESPDGNPLDIAVIYLPELTEERIRVDEHGRWQGSAFPVWKSSPIPLEPGEVLLKVAAPGFIQQEVRVKLRKRRTRRVNLVMEPLVLDLDVDLEEPHLVFGIDKPLD